MKINQKKLKEFMYLSLLGEYAYMELNRMETIICFRGTRPFCPYIVKPICITSNKSVSENITKERIIKFEEKVLAETSNLHKSELKNNAFSIDERINLFVKHFYKNNLLFDLYKNNLETLQKCGLIDEIQCLGAIKFVENLRNKKNEENHVALR